MERKCIFIHALIANQCQCSQAEHVTRRNGPDVICAAETANTRCAALLNHLKDAALPAFGVEDDLLTMPHSTLVKIHLGGLLGLQKLLDPATSAADGVEDVDAIVARAEQHYGSVNNIPVTSLIDDMTGYKLRRGRGR